MNQVKDFFDYIINAIKIWVIVQPWEQGLIVRCGKKTRILVPGIYFRIPYFDSVYIQESRLRVVDLPVQTVTSKDLKTITLSSSIGYSIISIENLYNTLFHPELTILNMVMSEVAYFVHENNMAEVTPENIEKWVLEKIDAKKYGLKFEYFKLINFAVVRTYRLIQDQSWTSEGLRMDKKT
jgi:regulator of protease activity HflC (stomatin/prohibitin superfamily)